MVPAILWLFNIRNIRINQINQWVWWVTLVKPLAPLGSGVESNLSTGYSNLSNQQNGWRCMATSSLYVQTRVPKYSCIHIIFQLCASLCYVYNCTDKCGEVIYARRKQAFMAVFDPVFSSSQLPSRFKQWWLHRCFSFLFAGRRTFTILYAIAHRYHTIPYDTIRYPSIPYYSIPVPTLWCVWCVWYPQLFVGYCPISVLLAVNFWNFLDNSINYIDIWRFPIHGCTPYHPFS